MKGRIKLSGEEKINPTKDKLKQEKIFETHADVKAIHEAFIANDSTILFIAVIPGKFNQIYYFTKEDPIQPIITDIKGRTTLSTINDLLRDIVEKLNKQSLKESDIETLEREFPLHLLNNKDVLSAACGEMREVWIYCQNKILEPVWDWVFWEKKKAFWGDVFNIIRIPENCKFEKSNFRIRKVAILPAVQDELSSWADEESMHIASRTGVTPEEITLNSSHKDLNDFNCIHIVADVEDERIGTRVRSAKVDKEVSEASDFNRLNNQKILFLNILNPSSKCDFRANMITELTAKTCIHTILTVQEDFAQKFADCFYECVVKEKNVAKALRKAREKIQKCDDVNDCKKFCRFAYVVSGNPYTQITWNDD